MGPQRPLANFGDPVFFILFLLPPWGSLLIRSDMALWAINSTGQAGHPEYRGSDL